MTQGCQSCDAADQPAVDVFLDTERGILSLGGIPVILTRTQFYILAYLVTHSERWITAAELIEQVLGTHHEPDTALIRVHIHNIRRRLGGAARYLLADRRYWRGYRWCTSGEAKSRSPSGTHELRLPRSH